MLKSCQLELLKDPQPLLNRTRIRTSASPTSEDTAKTIYAGSVKALTSSLHDLREHLRTVHIHPWREIRLFIRLSE